MINAGDIVTFRKPYVDRNKSIGLIAEGVVMIVEEVKTITRLTQSNSGTKKGSRKIEETRIKVIIAVGDRETITGYYPLNALKIAR